MLGHFPGGSGGPRTNRRHVALGIDDDPEHIGKLQVSIPLAAYLRPDEMLEILPRLVEPEYDPIKVITLHTRTTAKFYGDDYAVEWQG